MLPGPAYLLYPSKSQVHQPEVQLHWKNAILSEGGGGERDDCLLACGSCYVPCLSAWTQKKGAFVFATLFTLGGRVVIVPKACASRRLHLTAVGVAARQCKQPSCCLDLSDNEQGSREIFTVSSSTTTR